MPPLSLENVVAYVVQVSLIAAVTGACLTVARVRSPRIRYGAWTALMWLAVVLPLIQPWDVTTTIVVEAEAFTSAGVPGAAAAAIDIPPMRPGAAAAWNPVVVVLLAGTICRLLWLLVGVIRLRGIAQRAGSDLTDGVALQEAMQTQADIRYSGDLAQPATCGFRRPIVLLPLTLRSLSCSVRRAVLAHELVHVKRRDWTALMVEELLRAALWFNPVVWWLVDRVHASREEVVDAEALKFVDGRRNYARALLAFADAPAIGAAPAFARRRHLFSRIKRLCEESPMSPRRLVAASCLVAVAAGTSGVYAVSAFPILAGDEVLVAPAAPVTVMAVSQDAVPPPPPEPPPAPLPPAVEVPGVPAPHAPPLPPEVQDPPPLPPVVRMRQTPEVLREVRPSYPLDAMRAGIDGSVEVEVMIGHEGKVTHARVIRSANPALDAPALEAARQWLFSKPTEGSVVRTIELIFALRRTTPALSHSDHFETEPDAVRVGSNIRTPMKIRDVRPEYPPIARSARVSGMVIVEVLIGRDGRVVDARILRSIPLLDQAAVDAVRQWEFRPTLRDGTPVPVIMTVTVNFTDR